MPRTAEQWNKMRTTTRTRILAGALEVFKQRGIHAASMESIAKCAGVSKGLTYNYFDSKEDLLAAVVSQWMDELAAFWEGIESESNPLNRLVLVLDRFCGSVKRDPQRHRLYFTAFFELEYLASIQTASRGSRKLAQQLDRVRLVSRDLFAQLGASDSEAEVAFFRLLTSGLAAEYIMSPKGFPMAALKKRIIFYYRTLAGARPAGKHNRVNVDLP